RNVRAMTVTDTLHVRRSMSETKECRWRLSGLRVLTGGPLPPTTSEILQPFGAASWADAALSLRGSKLRCLRVARTDVRFACKNTRNAIFKSTIECPTKSREM